MTRGQDGGATGGPTVLRMLLGNHLRRLREERGVSREEAGYKIRSSESKISRMELGRVSFKQRDVADLLTLYGLVDEQERQRLLALARNANTPGWWHRYGDVLPAWFQSYVGLEAAANAIRSYDVQFIPGLLQTRDYARAVVVLGHRQASEQEVEHRVNLRMDRQRILARPDPPQLWVVIDEGVLHRPVGGTKVMRAQIEALASSAALPNVRLQVMPFRAGGHAGAGGSFSILRFPDPELPDVVYIEQLTSALYLDKPEDVEPYATAIEVLCIKAEPPDRTDQVLDGIQANLNYDD
jgi:transcriptional regulator with XRE-family HTH domain